MQSGVAVKHHGEGALKPKPWLLEAVREAWREASQLAALTPCPPDWLHERAIQQKNCGKREGVGLLAAVGES
jgi:hypothetical protein